MLRAFLLLAAIGLSAPAGAQTIDVARLTPGEVMQFEAHNGHTTLRYVGRTAKGYRFDFSRDGSEGAPASVILYTDRKSQPIRREGEGWWVTHDPHDCSLTVGDCSYVERRSDGASRSVLSRISVANGVWSYTLHHGRRSPETLLEKGRFTVDGAGVVIDRDYQNAKGERFWTRRIR